METLEDQLIRHEGIRLKPYRDTMDKWTIGVGHLILPHEMPTLMNGINKAKAMELFRMDLAQAKLDLVRALPWVKKLTQTRQNVLINMTFNLGIQKLLGFHTTLRHIEHGEYIDAAIAMLESKWATQVGKRARELAIQMRTG